MFFLLLLFKKIGSMASVVLITSFQQNLLNSATKNQLYNKYIDFLVNLRHINKGI